MKVAYVRVSTAEQNEDRQVKALEKNKIDKWFIDKISGKNTNRPKLKEMLDFVREGDVIYVHDLSRMARSTMDLLKISKLLQEKGVHLVSNKESVDTTTPAGRLMFTMVGAIAEFERDVILERQREGIALAKEKGKYKARKAKEIPNFGDYYERYMRREITKAEIQRENHVSRTVVDRYFREHMKKNNIITKD